MKNLFKIMAFLCLFASCEIEPTTPDNTEDSATNRSLRTNQNDTSKTENSPIKINVDTTYTTDTIYIGD